MGNSIPSALLLTQLQVLVVAIQNLSTTLIVECLWRALRHGVGGVLLGLLLGVASAVTYGNTIDIYYRVEAGV